MSGRAVVAVAVALLVAPALVAAGGAQRKDGGSSGSSRSASSSSRSSSSSTKSSSTSTKSSSASTKSSSTKSSSASARSSSARSGGRSSVSSGRDGASRPPTTGAQRRHPRPGTGSGSFDLPYYGGDSYGGYYLKDYRGPRYPSYSYPYYFSPFYRPGYGYIYGYGPYRSGYGFAPYSSYGYSGSSVIIGPGVSFGGGASVGEEDEEEEVAEGAGSLRILVQPEKTRVFVNGSYAGTADDYDGILQRLRLPAGRQEIELRLDGYRTQRFAVDVLDGETVKIEHKMVRGFGEEASERYAGQPVGHARFEEEPEQRYEAYAGVGTVRLAVRPEDASIYVDGAFHGTGGAASAVALPPGRHRIEVVRPGYRTVERDVDVAAGETAEVDVELERN